MGVPILAFQPEITRVQAEGRRQRVLVATKVLMKFNTAVSIFITIALIVFSREIIVVVANRNYLGAEPLLVILCLSLPFSSLTAPVTAVMKAFDQVRGAFYCDLAWAVVYIGLLFALGIPFGIIGLGLAQVLACAVQLLLALLISNLNLRYGFIIGLAAKLTAGGIAAFLPFLALEISRDLWRSALLFYIIKVVLFIPALFCFNWIIRKIEIFDSGDKTVLSAIFDKRGLGVFSRLF
jgi:O-antigen/teichoic acid export membrane protein